MACESNAIARPSSFRAALVTAGKPGIISRRFQFNGKGDFRKTPVGHLVKGRLEALTVTVEGSRGSLPASD